MSNVAAHPLDEFTPKRETPKPEEIRRQLAEILSSPTFKGSKRCQQFLAYVCGESLVGATASLKERTIAVEVFGRNPNSDLADDTIVRVGAREVRKRLSQYYLTPEGGAAKIRIELSTGSYAPEFRYASVPTLEKPPEKTVVEVPATESRKYYPVAVAVIAIIIAATVLTVRWTRGSPEERAFNQFWEPVFHSSEPLLVAIAHPIVYHPSARAWQLSESSLPPPEINVPRPLHVPPDKLDGSDILPIFNQYVGFGDTVAANEVTAMLAQRSKKVRLRMASGIEFSDLRKTNTLLIGAVSNRWTMQLQQSWRFQFRWTPGVRTVVVDTTPQQPGVPQQGRREWFIDSKADSSYQEDYVVVCRIRDSLTGGLLLAGAGLKGFGTEAAGRLLVDAEQLGRSLKGLPADWDAKNLQIVLHVKVIGNTPSQPEVVAWHVW
jgi:hypothetical protein